MGENYRFETKKDANRIKFSNINMKNITLDVIIIFILFQNIITRFLPSYFTYWDELLLICTFVIYIVSINTEKIKLDYKYILLLFILIVIGGIGNILFNYQTVKIAIFKDIVEFIKFPIAFIALYRMRYINKIVEQVEKLIPIVKCIIYIIFVLGVVSVFVKSNMNQSEIRGFIHPYMFIYTHPTYLTTGMICFLCILDAAGKLNKIDEIAILGSIILAMRTKGLAFIAAYIIIKYGCNIIKKIDLHKFKHLSNENLLRLKKVIPFIYGFLIIIVVLIVAGKKILLYASFSNSPRESLYVGGVYLMKKCFPIGAGFATYASHISGNYLSKVYSIINFNWLYDINGQVSPNLGDAGLAYYLGQFGVLGMIFLGLLVYKMVKMTIEKIDNRMNIFNIYMWLMIAISLPTEAILINNGFEIAFVLVVVYYLSRRNTCLNSQL